MTQQVFSLNSHIAVQDEDVAEFELVAIGRCETFLGGCRIMWLCAYKTFWVAFEIVKINFCGSG